MMIFESEKAMEDALFEVIERTKVVPWDCSWRPTSAGQSPESFYDELTSEIAGSSENNCDIGF